MPSMVEDRGIKGWILAIETSHAPGSVALAPPDGGVPVQLSFPPGLVHARELLLSIDELCRRHRVERAALALIAVDAGPGSYTGVRVGVAAAKALAFALGIPALGISGLETIAANVPAASAAGPGDVPGGTTGGTMGEAIREFAVLLDARRASCYGARFAPGSAGPIRLSPDRVLAPAVFFAELPPHTVLVGSGADVFPEGRAFPRGNPSWDLPLASGVCTLARRDLAEIHAGRRASPPEFADPHRLVPSYLRASEAEEKWNARRARGGD